MVAALKTVLMIEDNPADVEIIREELALVRGTEFTVETASNLADGLTYIGEHAVNGILLDLSLPDSHGLETFMRTREQAPELPIVVLTGNEDEELGLQAVREGAQDYIVKGNLKGSGLARAIEYAIERKVVDTKLRRAKELEAISHLSMGMVKDINNVLAVILMNLQSLEWPLRDDDFLSGQIKAARRAVFYGANLTKRLSGLSTEDAFSRKLIDINEQIANMADALSNVAEKGTAVETVFATTVSPVLINTLDLETALIGLVANARDSMLGGGRIVITTEDVKVADGEYAENDVGHGLGLRMISGYIVKSQQNEGFLDAMSMLDQYQQLTELPV